MKRTFLISLLSVFALSASAQQVTFRGVNHCGKYPDEKNLLKQMFDERRGMMGLARINPERLDVVSEFRITDGSGACFSHPTIFDGILYVRRGPAFMAFNIKKD